MPRGVYKRTKPVWNKGLTKETDKRVQSYTEKKKETCLKKYGHTNVLQSKMVLDKIDNDRHSGKLAQKARETKKLRYGDPNYNNMKKNLQTKKDRYGNSNYNNMEKMFSTKRSNRSFNTSKPEEDLYKELCEEYGVENVIRQYKDDRYPFKCDFYIPSEDLFIELNYHQSHGLHPFNIDNIEDLELLDFWRSKQNKEGKRNQYWIYEDVFTKTDPMKLNCARENNLNYLMIYRNNLRIKI